MSRRKKKKVKLPCEICKGEHFLSTHHIQGRDVPNCNHSSNLVDICDNCHREIHMGEIIIEGWFQTTGGKELIWYNKNEKSLTGESAKVHIFGEKRESDSTEPPD